MENEDKCFDVVDDGLTIYDEVCFASLTKEELPNIDLTSQTIEVMIKNSKYNIKINSLEIDVQETIGFINN